MKFFGKESLEKNSALEESSQKLWSSIEGDVINWCAVYAAEKYKGYEEDEIEEEKEKLVERERVFIEKAIQEIDKMQSENPNEEGLVLFDIDDTLGHVKFNKNGTDFETIVRPSTAPLFELLKREYPNIHIGILSVRAQDAVIEQLKDPKHLASIGSFVDMNHVYSTRDYFPKEADGPEDYEAVGAYLKGHPLINKPNITEDLYYERWTPGDYQKLEVLKHIKTAHPKMSIMAVDDACYPEFMQYGVCVYPEAVF